MRRVEDLNSELRSAKQIKEEKDSKLKAQIARNQDLLAQLDSLNYELSQTRQEVEMTQALKLKDTKEMETTLTKTKN
jgi:hypothetical protein